jgi:hypothetical protein
MLKSNRLTDIEILSLQNYSIAVRGHARTCSARRSKPRRYAIAGDMFPLPSQAPSNTLSYWPSGLPLEGGDV